MGKVAHTHLEGQNLDGRVCFEGFPASQRQQSGATLRQCTGARQGAPAAPTNSPSQSLTHSFLARLPTKPAFPQLTTWRDAGPPPWY
jgi:hypothetical protein